MSRRNIRDWEKLAASDPYFWVLTDDRYHSAGLTEDAIEHFFASGTRYVDFLLAEIRQRLDSTFVPRRALDFGCGVGRIAIALARVCREVIAVDAAHPMLSEMKRNCERLNIDNIRMVLLPEFLNENEQGFDLVNAYITFQHIPQREGRPLYLRLLQAVRPDGIIALHFLYHRPGSPLRRVLAKARGAISGINSLANILERKPVGSPYLQMNPYDATQVFLDLQVNGCKHAYIRLTDHGGFLGVLIIAQRSERPVP